MPEKDVQNVPANSAHSAQSTAPKHVLLIDDEVSQLKLRTQILHNAGIATLTAGTGEAALGLMRSEQGPTVRAIVTDHMLPGLGGADLVRALRALRPEIPILVITGLPDAEPEYAGLRVRFHTKPFPAEDLIASLRALIA